MKQAYFEVGQIVNTFGIKGFVKVKPFTDDMERFRELKSVLVEKNKVLAEGIFIFFYTNFQCQQVPDILKLYAWQFLSLFLKEDLQAVNLKLIFLTPPVLLKYF